MKIVINDCYGGFNVSHEGMLRYFEIKGQPVWPEISNDYWKHWTYWTVSPENRTETKEGEAFYAMSLSERQAYNEAHSNFTVYHLDIKRDDPALVQMVEELGKKASGVHSKLKVVQIPDDVNWYIHEYDGMEHVSEEHRTWH